MGAEKGGENVLVLKESKGFERHSIHFKVCMCKEPRLMGESWRCGHQKSHEESYKREKSEQN